MWLLAQTSARAVKEGKQQVWRWYGPMPLFMQTVLDWCNQTPQHVLYFHLLSFAWATSALPLQHSFSIVSAQAAVKQAAKQARKLIS